jgi:hypothetical protein
MSTIEDRDDELDLYEEDFDPENESYDEEEEQPFDPEKIKIETTSFSVRDIMALLSDKDEEGQPKEIELFLQPDFQRDLVWSETKRKSLFIESLMLKIPIPAFYFYEENRKYYVIDGLQRLSTIDDYINNRFKLSGLQYLGKRKNTGEQYCEGKYFRELEHLHKSRIWSTKLNINIINPGTPTQVKYDIFRRINTGGKPLNPQEIRNSIAKKEIRDMLNELVQSKEYSDIIGKKVNLSKENQEKRVEKDVRMRHRELILRYIAFYNIYDFETNTIKLYDKETNTGYLKSTPKFLDYSFDFINELIPNKIPNKKGDASKSTEYEKKYKEGMRKINEYSEKFKKSMNLAHILFDDYAFKRILPEDLEKQKPIKTINKSLFVAWGVILSYCNLTEKELSKKRKLVKKLLADKIKNYKETYKEGELSYSDALSKSTNDIRNVLLNFKITREIFDEVLLK